MDKEHEGILVKTLKQDGIIYSINEEEKKAYVIGCNFINRETIIIPRCINQGSKEYTVTDIRNGSFRRSNIKSIQFAQDSKLQTIEEAFNKSSIESLEIPSEVRELKGEWCMKAYKLTKVTVSPYNPYFKAYDGGKMII